MSTANSMSNSTTHVPIHIKVEGYLLSRFKFKSFFLLNFSKKRGKEPQNGDLPHCWQNRPIAKSLDADPRESEYLRDDMLALSHASACKSKFFP